MGQHVFTVACAHGGGDARSAMVGGCCEHGAARGEGEREKWSDERIQQALALFWSTDARRGDLGNA